MNPRQTRYAAVAVVALTAVAALDACTSTDPIPIPMPGDPDAFAKPTVDGGPERDAP